MIFLKKLFVYNVNLLLYWISKLIPKDEKIWIFGAWFGDKYGDNSKYLFEYILKNHPELRAVWITRNIDVIRELQSKGCEVYLMYSWKAIVLGLRAKYSIFVQSNMTDCMPFLNNGKTFNIQLWHGIPLKKIGYDDVLFTKKEKVNKNKELLFPFLREYYHFIPASSLEDKKHLATAFKNQNIKITGYPRNDNLFNNKESSISTITYLPTFRDNVGSSVDLFSEFNFNVEKWNQKLEELSMRLNIKMHPVNKPNHKLLKIFLQYKNINFLDNVDASEILTTTNILITDYSSVYFDFLLTDRPIIFTPFDYEKYIIKDRELYYNYDEVTPGPKCKNWNEVLESIEKFKKDSTLYAKERKIVKDRFHKYQDNKSCKRVYNEIIKLGL